MNSLLKQKVAAASLKYLSGASIVGVGSGTTVDYFIEELATIKARINGCVASSVATENKLLAHGLPVIPLNSVDTIDIYIDSADEVNEDGICIKGGGGAMTREKILRYASQKFLCIVDGSKYVKRLGLTKVPVEVLPLARSFVGRKLLALGGSPKYREGYVTDNGNIILDVFNLDRYKINELEDDINAIPGVVDNGIFANFPANKILIASDLQKDCQVIEVGL
jgi:ribose 5-phosphate isomerase A